MNFKPLGKRVLVKLLEEATTTVSGIIIPDNAKEKPSRGKVVAVSEDIKTLKNDDNVVFGKDSGNEISFDGKKYIVLDVNDIFGLIG